MKRVLVVDDDAVTCRLLGDVLRHDGVEVTALTDPRQAIGHASAGLDLAIVDLHMPELGGLDLVKTLRSEHPDLPIILMTGFASIDTVVEAIASGVVDYVSKPMNVEELRTRVANVLRQRDRAEAPLPRPPGEVSELAGRTPAMVDVYKTVARVASGRSTVLILGESGTGKELVARAIHRHGPRAAEAFVAVDCGALTETLLESELFGHVRGSFTGAFTDRSGLFAEADGGTIFLDEVGEVTPALQAKLLRVLQEHQVRPVGGTQWQTVDVRVIAATNRDLSAAVAAGRFREDLYYRLKVVTIEMPPLRERAGDVPLLVEHAITRAAKTCAKRVSGVSQAALELLCRYAWPGNVRELMHVIERAVALAQGDVLGVDDLPAELSNRSEKSPTDIVFDRPTLDELKRRYIERVLADAGGNISRAATVLGVDRRSLYRMLQRHRRGNGHDALR